MGRITNERLAYHENKIGRLLMMTNTLYVLAQIHRTEPVMLQRILDVLLWIHREKQAAIQEMRDEKEAAEIERFFVK